MKGIQKYRLGVQIIALALTAFGLFVNFKITMLIILGSTLLAGPFHCGWLCPYGLIQDLFSKLGRHLGIKKRALPSSLHKVLVLSRYIVFAIVMLVGIDFVFTIVSFDPRSNVNNILMGYSITIGSMAIIGFFSLISLFFERPFCNYLCSEGAKYGLLSAFRIFTIQRDSNKCVGCNKCDRVCPMHINVSACEDLRSLQCINCFQCISHCPIDGALQYKMIGTTPKSKKQRRAMATLLLITLTAFTIYHFNHDTHLLANNLPIKNETPSTPAVIDTPPFPIEGEPKNNEEGIPVKSNEDANEIVSEEPPETMELPAIEPTPQAPNDTIEITGTQAESLGDAAGIADGTYTGEGQGYRGMITSQVTVKDEHIVSIMVIEEREDDKWFNRAYNTLPNRIIEAQSTAVDLVSGATYSSRGIRDSVIDALTQAQ